MYSTSIPVKRDHRRANTDRLDCQLMMRAFLGWLRREECHCRMVAVPTARQEDARRVTRERKGLVREQTKPINRLKAMFACLGIRRKLKAMSVKRKGSDERSSYGQLLRGLRPRANHAATQNYQSTFAVVLTGHPFAEQFLQARESRCQKGSWNSDARNSRGSEGNIREIP